MKSIAHGKYNDRDLDRELRDIIIAIRELQTGGLLTTGPSTSAVATSSGSSTTITAEAVKKTLSANVASIEVFAYPAKFMGFPRCWAIQDGIYSEVAFMYVDNRPASFTITPVSDCTLEYSYTSV
jgi:hypothetical protein